MGELKDDIEKYLKGDLTPAEMHALEKKALSDPFLADALEGAAQLKADEFSQDVSALDKTIARQKSSGWIIPMRIAAGVAILAAVSFIVWFTAQPKLVQNELALEEKNKKEESITEIPTTKSDSITKSEPVTSPTLTQSPASGATKKQHSLSNVPSKKAAEPEVKQQPVAGEVNKPVVGEKSKEAEIKIEELPTNNTAERIAEKSSKDDEANNAPESDRKKKSTLPTSIYDKRLEGTIPTVLAKPAIISGYVLAYDGKPLQGVDVTIKGSPIKTETDDEGRYSLTTPHKNQTLVYSFIGLEKKEIIVGENRTDTTRVDIKMEEDATALNEVVLIASSEDKRDPNKIEESSFKMAQPAGGNREFTRYLEQNIRYPQEAKDKKIEGRVTVEFTIEDNGALTNFKVLRGIGYGCDEELIRVIKAGPKWTPTTREDEPLQDTVKVRFKFELGD